MSDDRFMYGIKWRGEIGDAPEGFSERGIYTFAGEEPESWFEDSETAHRHLEWMECRDYCRVVRREYDPDANIYIFDGFELITPEEGDKHDE